MAAPVPSAQLILHIWPGKWGLPSFDPMCLAAVLYLQLSIPGKFSIVECSNPDLSPSGQLPYLLHEQYVASPLAPIIKYVSGLKNANGSEYPTAKVDASLSPFEKSQKVAWLAHVESHLGDLVYHMLYSLHANWQELTHTTLVSILPLPQRYYVPSRMRESYRPRLEASGLWNLPGIEQEEKKPFKEPMQPKNEVKHTEKFIRAFEREKVLEKARSSFDIYTRMLQDKTYFYHEKIGTLDIMVATHTLLLLNPPYPDPLLQTLLTDSYPALTSHARRVQAQAFGSLASPIPTSPALKFSLQSLVPWPSLRHKVEVERTEEDVHYDRMRWSFFGLAIGSLAAYFAIVGSPIMFVISTPNDGEGEDHNDLEDSS